MQILSTLKALGDNCSRSEADVPPTQIIVLDKLDYCATLRNLDSVKDHKNMKVRMPSPTPSHLGPHFSDAVQARHGMGMLTLSRRVAHASIACLCIHHQAETVPATTT